MNVRIFLASAVMVATLLLPTAASAATAAELKAQVDSLLQRLRELQVQMDLLNGGNARTQGGSSLFGTTTSTNAAAPNAPTCSITAPSSAEVGDKIKVEWTSEDARKIRLVRADGDGLLRIAFFLPKLDGSRTFTVRKEGTYAIGFEVTGSGGTGSCSTTVQVSDEGDAEDVTDAKGRIESLSYGGNAPDLLTFKGTAEGTPTVSFRLYDKTGNDAVEVENVKGIMVTSGKWTYYTRTVVGDSFTLELFDNKGRLLHRKGYRDGDTPVSTGTVTLDNNGKTFGTKTPTLTGSATGTSNIGMLIFPKGKDYTDYVYRGGGGTPVVNGRWSHTVGGGLDEGSYVIWFTDRATNENIGEGAFTIKLTSAVVVPPTTTTPSPVSGSVTADTLLATPTSGTVPFQVLFSGTVNGARSCSGGSYTLAFGDGTTYSISVPANLCQAKSWSVLHTYKTKGSFTAALHKGASAAGTVVAKKTITGFTGSLPGVTPSTPTVLPPSTIAPIQYWPVQDATSTGSGSGSKSDEWSPLFQVQSSAYAGFISALEAIQAQLIELID